MKNSIIKKLENTYCRLKRSKIDGVGIFAIRDIPKNKNPFQGIRKQNWYKLKLSDFKNLDKEVLKMADDFFDIEKDGKAFIPDFGLNGNDPTFLGVLCEEPDLK